MKKVFVLSLLAFAALVACQKNSAPVEENGVPMSISISWNDVTKTYQKTTGKQIDSFWDGKESVSIISLGEKQEVLAIDNFVSEDVSGAETAVFTGKFTGGEPYSIKVMYPALDEKSQETPSYDAADGSRPLLYLQDKWSFTSNIAPLIQNGNNDLKHFTNFCVAVGDADFKAADSGVLVMKNPLQNVSSVLKFELKLPEKIWGASLDELKLWCVDAKDNPRNMFACGKEKQAVGTLLSNGGVKGATENNSATNKWTLSAKFEVPKGGEVTLFMPVYFLENAAGAGDVWNFEVTVAGDVYKLGKKEFKEDTKLARGYMYRIQIDASAEGIPAPGWEDGDEVPLS